MPAHKGRSCMHACMTPLLTFGQVLLVNFQVNFLGIFSWEFTKPDHHACMHLRQCP